ARPVASLEATGQDDGPSRRRILPQDGSHLPLRTPSRTHLSLHHSAAQMPRAGGGNGRVALRHSEAKRDRASACMRGCPWSADLPLGLSSPPLATRISGRV
ncbi:MAG TPA: hypothetical protein VI542_32420, partial [Candidatus Tectomicrobia bacterium]